ncbi:MAG: ABC transporter ATP-binding protein [Crocinitomicaceae bacterium]|nr:MAG: ABC transporter ATP-binding protein [Crocinitomicaceae bacterium]
MKEFLEIYRYTFTYRGRAILVIVSNLLFVIFNLISLVLFIPVLQLIFKPAEEVPDLIEPNWTGNFLDIFAYIKDSYNYFMQKMVNEDPKDALLFVCISVFAAFFLKNLFRYAAVWHQSELRMAVVRDVRNKLFSKAMNLPLSFYSNERKGDLMARMNSDVGEIEIAVMSVLEIVYREPIAIIINIAMLVYLSPQLTLISFILLPISAFVISRIGKSLKKTAKSGQEQMGIVYSSIDENLSGIRIIKAFNAIDQVYEAFKAINLKHQQLITKTFRKKDLSPILNETLGAGVMLCLVWFGGVMILGAKNDAVLTGEVFITFIIVFSQLLRPIQGIATNMAFLNKARASQDRINEILNTDERIYEVANPTALPELNIGIRYENVSFKYKDEYVLKNINLTINKGKTIALVGESGSGKSTLGDLLPRFYDVNDGTIYFDNIPITECSILDLRNHIGIVSQESILFNTSVRENIAFGMPNATLVEVENAARIANAHDFIMNLDSGYETNIGERGNKLSGGQKQRISIARAVLKNPNILILDEATSALDTESEKLVQDALDKLMKDRTSIIIAHRLSTIRNADEIILLSKGEIKERGTHDELIQLKGMYYNLCSLQGIR